MPLNFKLKKSKKRITLPLSSQFVLNRLYLLQQIYCSVLKNKGIQNIVLLQTELILTNLLMPMLYHLDFMFSCSFQCIWTFILFKAATIKKE